MTSAIRYSSLIDLLKNETKIVMNKIYSAKNTAIWSCQAIFQSLSALSRYLILRLLFLEVKFKLSEIYLMINQAKEEEIDQLFDELLGLDLFTDATPPPLSTATAAAAAVATTNGGNNGHSSSIPSDLIDLTGSSSSRSSNHHQNKYASNPTLYKLNPFFQQSLIQALTQPANPWEIGTTKPSTATEIGKIEMSVSKEFLEEYRINEWNKVLSYLLGIYHEHSFSSTLIPTFMNRFGLMMKSPTALPASSSSSISLNNASSNNNTHHHNNNNNSSSSNNTNMVITAKGYEFLLKDYYHQIWDYVSIALMSINKEENLSLLFMLSYTNYGQAYSTSYLTKSQNIFLFELSQIGIIYLPDGVNSKKFYPTKTIINLIFGMSHHQTVGTLTAAVPNPSHILSYSQSHSSTNTALASSYFSSPVLAGNDSVPNLNNNNGKNLKVSSSGLTASSLDDHRHQLLIIVETNLQVVAYVTNDLHVALLRLFVDIHIRFANMVIGRITRDKSQQAFKIGMKSAQMIDFLMIHAHPVVAKRVKIIPENVVDQLILWESELYRIQAMEAKLFDFQKLLSNKPEIYHELVKQLNSLNLILWEDSTKKCFVCDPSAESMIQNFLNSMYTQLF